MKLLTPLKLSAVAGGSSIPQTIVIPEKCMRMFYSMGDINDQNPNVTLGDVVNQLDQDIKKIYSAGCGPYLEI